MTIKLFHVQCGPRSMQNFGDEASSTIVRQVSGQMTERVGADHVLEADIVSVGSILHLIPGDYRGVLWGPGIIRDDMEFRYPQAKICALRGKLTAKRLGVKDIPLGDPLLLWTRPKVQVKYELGIVPHYVDWEDERIWRFARKQESVLVIDPLARDVPERMASCKAILSSSLHGLVVADAFGIPNLWTILSDGKIVGGSFKYRDYYSVFNMDDPIPYRFEEVHTLDYVLDRIAERWSPRPLGSIRHGLLSSFPSALKIGDEYKERIKMLADNIPAKSSVMDLGCGAQVLREYAEGDYLPVDRQYGEGITYADFNNGIYPVLDKTYDFAVVSGLLEYLYEPETFLEWTMQHAGNLLMSYAIRTSGIAERLSSGWVNHFTRADLEKLFAKLELSVTYLGDWRGQGLYKLWH